MTLSNGEQRRPPAPPADVDAICDVFEAGWLAGQAPRIEDFLPRGDAVHRDVLLRELLLAEWDLCWRHKQDPELQTYYGRFPESRHSITDLWRVWKEKPSESVFNGAAIGVRASRQGASVEGIGTVIDCYKLVEKLGEGGFGTVWAAEQIEPVRRRIALKVIKLGMDSKQVVARFEAEKQALALMDHPNIAKVLDAGTTDSGRPYFVMELVKGQPITQYCDERQLTPRQRLELLLPVCHAIQHAHQKGIIHRDIKPTNILVAEFDQQPVPKVIDFGVAKAISQPLTQQTMFTGYGQIIGTLEYMSPEQAQVNQLDIDTRSDIYSLGVLLYELLTGSTPFDKERIRSTAFDEMLRIIREEEPPKPSTKLSSSETLQSVAASRGMEPARLSRTIRSELDWIVMKALEKDRSRRYATVNGFASDVERYLANEPILACPPSTGYRLKKFARRNKGPVAAAAVVLLTLVGGIVGTTWQAVRAEQARRSETVRAEGERRAKEEAQTRLTQIEKGTEILASVFRDLDPIAAETAGVTSRDLLSQRLGEAAQQLEGEAVGDPLVVAQLQHLLGISLRELGHLEQAEVVLLKACQTRQRLLGTDHLATVAAKHDLARLYRDVEKYAPAEALYKEVLSVRTARLGAEHPDTLTSQHHLAILYDNQRKGALAEALFKEVLAVRTATLGTDHPDVLASQHRLALLYMRERRFALAETLCKEVLAVRTATLGADNLDTLASKNLLAVLYSLQEKYTLAEALFMEVLAGRTAKLGAGHPDVLTSRNHLALLYRSQGKVDLAEALLREVVVGRTAKLGADHLQTRHTQHELASLLADQGKFALAATLYKEMLAVRTAKLGPDHPETLESQYNLAITYGHLKKFERAIPLLEEALQRSKANEYPGTLVMQADLGAIYCGAGRFADGIPLLEEVHWKGRKDPELAWVGDALLTAYVRAGKTTEAAALVTERVRDARHEFPVDSPELAAELACNGKMLLDAKAFAEAEPLLLEGYAGLSQTEVQLPPEVKKARLRDAAEWLVQLYDAWGKPDEAAMWRNEL